MKPGGCSYGDRCKYSHKVNEKTKKEDCKHWMKDKCIYADKICMFKHDPRMKGVHLDVSRREGGQVQGFANPPVGLASHGVILGGGAPQFGQFSQLGGQGASMWGQAGSHSWCS